MDDTTQTATDPTSTEPAENSTGTEGPVVVTATLGLLPAATWLCPCGAKAIAISHDVLGKLRRGIAIEEKCGRCGRLLSVNVSLIETAPTVPANRHERRAAKKLIALK
jgi:hypothetical protein